MENLITLKNINKTYLCGGSEIGALKDISVTIDRGEFLSVVGSSGSGKSTLMNIIGFLDAPSSGDYIFCGNKTKKLSDNELSDIRGRKIGFIFQGFNLIPGLSAVENVELPLIYRGIPKAKRISLARTALDRVGLSDRLHHRPSQLSGGQSQRVAIARAIAMSPHLILADEPTGNLDSVSGEQILDILKTLNSEGHTVIIITHDKELAKNTPRCITIKDGRLFS